jgi:hypothetical protein
MAGAPWAHTPPISSAETPTNVTLAAPNAPRARVDPHPKPADLGRPARKSGSPKSRRVVGPRAETSPNSHSQAHQARPYGRRNATICLRPTSQEGCQPPVTIVQSLSAPQSQGRFSLSVVLRSPALDRDAPVPIACVPLVANVNATCSMLT